MRAKYDASGKDDETRKKKLWGKKKQKEHIAMFAFVTSPHG